MINLQMKTKDRTQPVAITNPSHNKYSLKDSDPDGNKDCKNIVLDYYRVSIITPRFKWAALPTLHNFTLLFLQYCWDSENKNISMYVKFCNFLCKFVKGY